MEVTRFRHNGSVDVIRLENKQAGLCIGSADRANLAATLVACSDDSTLWQKIAMSGNRAVFRRDAGGGQVCLAKNPVYPNPLSAVDCGGGYADWMVWEAYVSG